MGAASGARLSARGGASAQVSPAMAAAALRAAVSAQLDEDLRALLGAGFLAAAGEAEGFDPKELAMQACREGTGEALRAVLERRALEGDPAGAEELFDLAVAATHESAKRHFVRGSGMGYSPSAREIVVSAGARMARALIAMGAKPMTRGKEGKTIWDALIGIYGPHGQRPAPGLLAPWIELGADVDWPIGTGKKSLLVAALDTGDEATVEQLLALGADPLSKRGSMEQNAMEAAVYRGANKSLAISAFGAWAAERFQAEIDRRAVAGALAKSEGASPAPKARL